MALVPIECTCIHLDASACKGKLHAVAWSSRFRENATAQGFRNSGGAREGQRQALQAAHAEKRKGLRLDRITLPAKRGGGHDLRARKALAEQGDQRRRVGATA